MAISKKSYIDLLGLTKFRDLLLKTTIDVDNDTSVDNKTASVSAILEYVSSVEENIINGVNNSLNSKVSSVGYASKKFTYISGVGTTDIVDISTLKTDIGTMTGATSSSAGTLGLVPAPALGEQTSFLRGDGTWAVPTYINTTYTVTSGDNNGQIKVTPSSGSAYNVSVKGLGSSAYTESSAYAPASHNHDSSYYLKTEIETKLNEKSDIGHTHTMSSITDLNLKTATSSTLGLVKSSTTGTTTNRDYYVEVNSSDGTMKVNVPWTDRSVSTSLATTSTKAYITGSTSTSATTEALVKDAGIYISGNTGSLVANTFQGELDGNASTATLATDSTYATKIGTSTNHPAIGSATQPVYVNSNGTITVGTALGTMAYKATGDFLASTTRGAKNGVASLDANGLVPSSQLPSYVDDVLEYTAKSSFPANGETGKIYVDTSTNLTYRWSGSDYVEISKSLALGETSSTAYAGDKGANLATTLSTHTSNTTVHITSTERTTWNNKYTKPSSGIPKTDLASAVQTSLGLADTALQSHQDISGKEDKSNKVKAWSTTTTDDHYPSEKLVKTALDGKSNTGHTHSYAGSSSAGGSANSAVKLDSTNIGNSTKPVYFDANGKPVAISYTIATNVPSSAVFTDTKVTQTAATDPTSYTNYRPLLWGSSNSATKGFTPSTVTGEVFACAGLYVRPSEGLIHATTFEGTASNASKVGNCSVETSLTANSNSEVPTSKAVADYLTSQDCRSYENNFLNKNMFSYASTVDNSSSAGSYSNGTITMGDGTINVPNGGIVAGSGIKGAKVYNAVWNDLVDCIPVDGEVELEYGYCYSFDGEKYHKSSEYMEQGVIGIHSDTAGMVMGSKPNTKELHCGVAGFCLAYVDKEYPVGTPLTCTEGGILTEIKHKDKVEYPERVIATYWKSESSEIWGSDIEKVKVNGRRWVKIR